MVADRAAMLARKAAEQKRKEKKFADELKHSKVVRNANRLRKRVNLARDRALATLTGKEAPLDPEQVRMMEALEQSGKENLEDKPHGVRNIKITVGEEESSKFLVQMQLLMDKKLPYYVRIEKAFGNQTYLWYQLTYNTQQFITTIDLGHTERNHPQYKDLSPSNYEAVSHPSLKLILWVKRDVTKLAGVGAIDFAFSEAEEKTFIDNGFEIAGPSLFEFDLPDSTIWIQRLDKVAKKVTKMNTAVATNHAISQLAKVRKLLSENPNNKNLKELEHKFIAELKSCYKREEEAEVEDPLQAAKKLMALDDDQVEQWIDVFAAIDKDKLGRVTLEQVFGELQEYMTDSGRLVFASMDAVGDDGYMEFGDFVLSVGTFCFFGLEEVLKFLYTNADKDKKGVITQAEYIDLLNDLHPFDKAKAVRVLKTMKRRPTEEISFETFVSDHEKFPMMLFPQLHLQRIMRRRVGVMLLCTIHEYVV
jgi:Ca2+-binding EF-hand superfamily protein